MIATAADGDDLDALARLAASGDEAALDQLLDAVRPQVVRVAAKFLPDRLDAEEAAQDALLSVSRAIGDYDGRSRFTTWLHQITANRSIDTYRRLRREWNRGGGVLPADLATDRRTSVLAGNSIDLLEATASVDYKFTEPVLLRDLCGLTYAEIAERLGVAEGTVASRIAEGRKRLQRAIDHQ